MATYLFRGAWTDEVPPADQILSTLKPAHPRLFIDADSIPRLKALAATDALVARIYGGLRADAEALLGQPPSIYEIPDGRRLLAVSRKVKERVQALALAHLMECDARYVERAWIELQAVCAFPDWNPSHFLDTAEMTYAVALGYDWLFDAWSPEQRGVLVEAIVDKGLRPGMAVYDGEATPDWPRGENNWNQVCNGGLGMGALAIADIDPDLAGQILYRALGSLPLAMGNYAPDGASSEGVTYWDYGSRFNLIFLSGLESALGTSYGLSEMAGFAESGTHQIHMSGADRLAFDFADCGKQVVSAAQHYWMARRYDRPEYAAFRQEVLSRPESTGTFLDLLWYSGPAQPSSLRGLPLDKHFRRVECASMRSSWDDPNAMVVALQGGLNSYHGHRHQDLGSLIVEALGERWIEDPGTEREVYQLHRHQRQRWEYYRIRAEGHNTLVLNPGAGPDQRIGSFAPITRFESTAGGAVAEIDLSDAYAEQARRVVRTVRFVDRAQLEIADHVEADRPADTWWFLHTRAEVDLAADGRAAMLRMNGKQLRVDILEGPLEAHLRVVPGEPLPTSPNPPEQALDPDLQKLAIHLEGVTDLSLTVRLTPLAD